MRDFLLGALVAFIFLGLAVAKKKPSGLYGLIFLLPIARQSASGYGLNFSYVALAVIAYFTGRAFSGRLKFSRLSAVPYKGHLMLLIVYLFFSLFLLVFKDVPSNLTYWDMLSQNVSYYFTATIAAVLLWLMINVEIGSEDLWLKCIKVFLWSEIYLGLIYVAVRYFHVHLPELLSPVWVSVLGGGNQVSYTFVSAKTHNVHFAGFIGSIENFAEYLFVVFCFAVMLLSTKLCKIRDLILGISAVAVSVLFSLVAAVKAYAFMIPMFLAPFAFFGVTRRHRWRLIVLFVCGLGILACFQGPLSKTLMYKRLTGELTERFEKAEKKPFGVGTVAGFMGRGAIVSEFTSVVETGGIVGVGPVNIYAIDRVPIPYHNLYYSLFLSFGLLGFIIYVSFFVRHIFRLWRCRKLDNTAQSRAVALVLIFAVLLFEQWKVSAFRVPYGLLSYWFILGLGSSLSMMILEGANGKKNSVSQDALPLT